MFRRNRSPRIEGNYRNWPDLAAYRREAAAFYRRLTRVQQSRTVEGIPLFSAMRNEAAALPRFLDHYRGLGVSRFYIVDNDSTDDTRKLLSRQPDVNLYAAADSYAAANGGTLWLDGLMYEEARGEWLLHVDADELLVYDRCDRYPVAALTHYLERAGQTSLFAPLVDLYPHPTQPEQVLFDAAPEIRTGTTVEGGPRYRMALEHGHQSYPCLTKYPLLRYGQSTAYANTHFPYPREPAGRPMQGRLLHWKLTLGFKTKVEVALREGQHWREGIEYRVYADWLGGLELGDLRTGCSRRYTGPTDLLSAALMQPIDWAASPPMSALRRYLKGNRQSRFA